MPFMTFLSFLFLLFSGPDCTFMKLLTYYFVDNKNMCTFAHD